MGSKMSLVGLYTNVIWPFKKIKLKIILEKKLIDPYIQSIGIWGDTITTVCKCRNEVREKEREEERWPLLTDILSLY